MQLKITTRNADKQVKGTLVSDVYVPIRAEKSIARQASTSACRISPYRAPGGTYVSTFRFFFKREGGETLQQLKNEAMNHLSPLLVMLVNSERLPAYEHEWEITYIGQG